MLCGKLPPCACARCALYYIVMGSSRKINPITIGIAALVVILVAAVWYMRRPTPPVADTTAAADGGLGTQIFEGAQNPLKNDVPDTNPFSANTNPFKAQSNPYKDEYKNPFQ